MFQSIRKHWLVVALAMAAISMTVLADYPTRTAAPPSGVWGYDNDAKTWRPASVDNTGALKTTGGSGTSSSGWRVNASTSGRANVATNSVTLLSSIAAITPPCTVQISCPAGQLWYAPGLATATVGSAKIHVLDEFQSITFNVATSAWDCSLIGVSAVSSCSVTIHSLVQ